MERHYQKYINTLRGKTGGRVTSRPRSFADDADSTLPQRHYSMAKKDRDHVDLYTLSNLHVGDPALKVRNAAHRLSILRSYPHRTSL